MLEHVKISVDGDGNHTAAGDLVGMTVSGDGHARLFKRRAVRPFGAQAREECMLVGELDGVRTYLVRRGIRLHVIVTRADLRCEFEALDNVALEFEAVSAIIEEAQP